MVYGVPPAILGMTDKSSFASTEALMQFWLARGLGFAINHIEVAFDHFFGLRSLAGRICRVRHCTRCCGFAYKDRIEALAQGRSGRHLCAQRGAPGRGSAGRTPSATSRACSSRWCRCRRGIKAKPETPRPDAPPAPPPAAQRKPEEEEEEERDWKTLGYIERRGRMSIQQQLEQIVDGIGGDFARRNASSCAMHRLRQRRPSIELREQG